MHPDQLVAAPQRHGEHARRLSRLGETLDVESESVDVELHDPRLVQLARIAFDLLARNLHDAKGFPLLLAVAGPPSFSGRFGAPRPHGLPPPRLPPCGRASNV
jgi:hypothetical protein